MNEKKPNKFVREFKGGILLLRNIPSVVVALFVVSVITMNILASKTIVETKWIAIDGGILVSWLSFLCMDIITKHYGPKAATEMSIFAVLVNLLVCFIFWLSTIFPSPEGMDFSAYNSVIGGTWFVLLSSTIAFISSAVINNFMNYFIGKAFKNNPDGSLAFITRSYISTFIGQFFDNLIFALFCFMIFAPMYWGFSWSFIQCVTCSLLGGLLELLMEVIFSPFGYAITKRWKARNVGKEYFDYVNESSLQSEENHL